MNSIIESLNLGGERFVQFAWPMLWQSSVLIAILFALDFMLQRKVRAAVRYVLWLVVMVKLLLPPTLAVPTSIAWWIRPNPPPKPPPRQYVVTYLDRVQTSTPVNLYGGFTAGALEVQHLRLSPAGWFVTASGTISVSLLLWMMLRWRHVARIIRASSPATQECDTLLDEAQRHIGLRRNMRLRLTDLPMSPAVCGLFRPMILLPRPLAEQLPPSQLRAVLLHELVHLKRGDVGANCAQALLQIAYWWHPLLWLANARIRRLREEAVDDTVMLALRDDAPTYAPTLLEVAKLAFHRPTTALGLVGIMESRSALRQRIERLVNSDTPRQSGLTILSAVGVLAFSALAVPMDKAPPKSKPRLLAQATASASEVAAESQRAAKAPATVATEGGQVPSFPGRLGILRKLAQIRVESVSYDGEPLEEVVRALNDYARLHDPMRKGVPDPADGMGMLIALSPSIGRERPVSQPVKITVRLPLKDITLDEVLEVIVMTADQPLRYSIEEWGVVFWAGRAAEPLVMRDFRLDWLPFSKWLDYVSGTAFSDRAGSSGQVGVEGQSIHRRILNLFRLGGVDLSPPKSVFYSQGAGALSVKVASADLETILRLVEKWNTTSPPAVPAEASTIPPRRGGVDFLTAPYPIASNRVPLLGDLLGLGKLFRSESNANRNASNRLSRSNELTNAVLDGGGASRGSERSSSESNSLMSPVPVAELLQLRRFKVNANRFCQGLQSVTVIDVRTSTPAEVSRAVVGFLKIMGVNMDSPGRSALFRVPTGELFVSATKTELDSIEAIMQVVNTTPPIRVSTKCATVELTTEDARALGSEFWLQSGSNNFGILTEAQFQVLRRALEQRTGVIIKTDTVPFGRTVDVFPFVLPDGQSIQMIVTPKLPLPHSGGRQITTTAIVQDGQTLVIENFTDDLSKRLIMFITPTIVDDAGNRIHPTEVKPPTQKVPLPQPSR